MRMFKTLDACCVFKVWIYDFKIKVDINGSQLAKMKKSIPDMSLP